MKLYNRTKCPNAILEPLLAAAGRAVGARTANVVVQVTQARGHFSRGMAYRSDYWGAGRTRTDCGRFRISLPNLTWGNHDAHEATEDFYSVALHEWAHIADFQRGNEAGPRDRRQANGRRIRHHLRPQEFRANNARKDALFAEKQGEIKSRDDVRNALADWFRVKGGA